MLVAALGRRLPALSSWGGALGLLLMRGLWDYWRWGYDYGHNLDMSEHAIIKIPEMTYQPPLIGRKKLLNFYGHLVAGVRRRGDHPRGGARRGWRPLSRAVGTLQASRPAALSAHASPGYASRSYDVALFALTPNAAAPVRTPREIGVAG
jgi:hypothetical protein